MAKIRGRSNSDDNIGTFNFQTLEDHINGNGKHRQKELPDSEVDHLSLMAREARRHGYGCHYGNYIAAFHPTLQKYVEPEIGDEEWLQDPYNKICPICGARFNSKSKDRLYCCDQCRYEASYRRRVLGIIPQKRRTRPVKAIYDDGRVLRFDSFNAACRETGIGKTLLKKSLDTGETVRGIRFTDDSLEE